MLASQRVTTNHPGGPSGMLMHASAPMLKTVDDGSVAHGYRRVVATLLGEADAPLQDMREGDLRSWRCR